MKWLTRLKESSVATSPDTTKPTEASNGANTHGFVGFAGVHLGTFPIEPPKQAAANASNTENDLSPGCDKNCWPHSSAMNTFEIDMFVQRACRFAGWGLSPADAEGLADRLVSRDRDDDGRRVCFECRHFRTAVGWRCTNRRLVGGGFLVRTDGGLDGDLAQTLHRCNGYAPLVGSTKLTKDFGEMD